MHRNNIRLKRGERGEKLSELTIALIVFGIVGLPFFIRHIHISLFPMEKQNE